MLLSYVPIRRMIQNIRDKQQTLSATSSSSSTTTTSSTVTTSSLAFQQSYGFFDDISDEDWKMRQAKARNHSHHDGGGDPLRYWNAKTPASMFYYYNYEPLFSCPHLHRVGGAGDGPKWTCDPHRIKRVVQRRNTTCLIYSIGCWNVYLWEDGLFHLLGPDVVCEFHIFDPGHFDRPLVNAQRNMHYHSWGIKSSYHNDTRISHVIDHQGNPMLNGTFLSLPETMRLLGHTNRTIDILKVDCESCEWFTYRDWIQYGDVRQLFVETHKLPMPQRTPRAWPWPGLDLKPTQFFDELQHAGFIMFSKEPNIYRTIQVSAYV